MDDTELRNLVTEGLAAQRAGAKIAREAQQEILDDASHPDLKAMLQQGQETAKTWSDRLDRAASQAGQGETDDNPILEAHYEVSRRIRAEADEDGARDLGIVAAGQLALHYWIAAFGTMRAYLDKLGQSDAAEEMAMSVDEAKAANEKHTEIARQIMAA